MKDGSTCLLWHHLWNNQVPAQVYPHLFSFTRDKHLSLKRAYSITDLQHLFFLPLTPQAYNQLVSLAEDLESLDLSPDPDSWIYIWGNAFFSSSKAYKSLIGHRNTHPVYDWLWKSRCQKKHKVFFWLVLKDRLSTRDIMRRKHMVMPSYNCVLCSHNKIETLFHLLLECSFDQECWIHLGLYADLQLDPYSILTSFKTQLQVPFFMEIIIIMSWCIWMTRNDLIFRGIPPTTQEAILRFKSTYALVLHRVKEASKQSMVEWLELML